MTAATDVLAVARRYLGVHETPAGSNDQRFGVWYGMNGVPWCAIFSSFCLYTAGYRFPDATTRKGFSYCPSIVAWGQKHSRISRTPHLGDLAVAVDGNRPHHVELVSRTPKGDGTFTSIGGNTGAANLSNGGEVLEHSHTIGTAWVFVSPYYTAPARPAVQHKAGPVKHAAGPVTRNLALTSPLTSGNDVGWVENRLRQLGYLPKGYKATKQYGPKVHDAVAHFQTDKDLVVDGVCGPITGDHLAAGR
jgi:peptidoglycan hydrolase-like protein with peptidoglycan-binding domain